MVELVRRTRHHPDLRVGSSVRGAIDCVDRHRLARLAPRGVARQIPRVGLDAALVALSGRVRVREGVTRSSEEIITELWQELFGPPAGDGAGEKPGRRRRRLRTPDQGRRGRRAGRAGGRPAHHVSSRPVPQRALRGDLPGGRRARRGRRSTSWRATILDEALALLADLTGATDPMLRALARRLAARLFLDLARRGPSASEGDREVGDATIRGSTGATSISTPASRNSARPAWPADRSTPTSSASGPGSPRELRCACSSTGRARWAGRRSPPPRWRRRRWPSASPDDYSVVAFGKECRRRAQPGRARSRRTGGHRRADPQGPRHDRPRRGAASPPARQLARSRAGRKVTVLLSDCRATVHGDVPAAARALDELVIIAPEGDDAEATQLAGQVGARLDTVAGPSRVADALMRVLGRADPIAQRQVGSLGGKMPLAVSPTGPRGARGRGRRVVVVRRSSAGPSSVGRAGGGHRVVTSGRGTVTMSPGVVGSGASARWASPRNTASTWRMKSANR